MYLSYGYQFIYVYGYLFIWKMVINLFMVVVINQFEKRLSIYFIIKIVIIIMVYK